MAPQNPKKKLALYLHPYEGYVNIFEYWGVNFFTLSEPNKVLVGLRFNL